MLNWIDRPINGSGAGVCLLVTVGAIALTALGIGSLLDAPLEVLLDLRPVRVETQTGALGLSPEEAPVERVDVARRTEIPFSTGLRLQWG